MEARQSSSLCAHIGLLLLLIGLICSHLPEVQGRPADFWCNSQARKNMQNFTENLKTYMAGCVGSDTLPSPIQLPCVWLRPAEWANKTVQQKSAEVVGTLQIFEDEVHKARNKSSSECQTSLLGKLEHCITNYILIVNQVYKQNDTTQSAVQRCSSVTRLDDLLGNLGKLLRGKLQRLANDLRGSICNGDHTTTNRNAS